jgi:hypothetical protein
MEMFTTQSLPLAAYLYLAKKLRLSSIQVNLSNANAEFLFEDPEGLGPELEIAFLNNEDSTKVPPNDYYNAIKFVRGKMQRTLTQKGVRRG